MSRNGSGTYTLPANTVSPASNGTIINPTDFNTVMDDIESAMTQSLSKDGQTVLTGDLDFNGNALILDADGDFSIQATADDQLAVVGGAINEAKGADIASATTTDIGAATGNYVDVTGTTTITGLGTVQAGARRIVQFDGSLTLTYNATSLILPGNTDIVTQAGDIAEFISLGSGNWICIKYQRDEAIIHPGTVSGYVSGITEYIEADTGADSTAFDVDANIAAAWESIGPTGSGADNIWTAMDSMPAGAKWVEVKFTGVDLGVAIYGRVTGSSTGTSAQNIIADSGNGERLFMGIKIPVDASNRFDLYATGTLISVSMYLIGCGI